MQWSDSRRWLQHHQVKYSKFPEEIEFRRLIKKHDFEQKAKDLIIVKAS